MHSVLEKYHRRFDLPVDVTEKDVRAYQKLPLSERFLQLEKINEQLTPDERKEIRSLKWNTYIS